MATSDFLKKLSSIGKASRPTKSVARNKSVQDSYLAALEKQIDAVNAAIKKPGSVQWNRGHWIKPEADGRYSVSFSFPAVAVVDGKKYFFVDDLKAALKAEAATNDRSLNGEILARLRSTFKAKRFTTTQQKGQQQ